MSDRIQQASPSRPPSVPLTPAASDADRLAHGFALESGESLPPPASRGPLH